MSIKTFYVVNAADTEPMDHAREDRWKAAVRHAGMKSQTDLAIRIGVQRQVISQLKSGHVQHVRLWPEVCALLNAEKDWLQHGRGPVPDWLDVPAPERQRDALLIPVVGRAAAAHGAHVDGDTASEPPLRIRDRWRAVVIHGDSGYPVVLDRQTVLVDPDVKPDLNRIVVVHTDKGPELKRWGGEERDGRVMLASLNAGRDPKLVRLSDYARQPEVVVGVVFTDSVAR